jgi:hypothetical protein
MAECFRAFTSCSSKASAQSTASRTPGACQIFVGISPRHPAADNSCHLGTQHLRQIDYSRTSTTHLHPLLGLAHRFQVTCYRRRVDKVGSASWISGERTTTSWVDSGSTSSSSSLAIAGAPRLATSASSGAPPAAPWVFDARPNGVSLGFGPCQQKKTGLVTLGGYDYSLRITAFVQCTPLLQCWPLVM